jgi:hypothetical protein
MKTGDASPRTVTKRLVMPEAYDLQIQLAASQAGVEPGEILRKAVDLFLIALENKKKGMTLGFVAPDGQLEVEVVGF